ncbi:MAG: hypothetical protein ACKPCO_04725 [Actinomycetota bacterium]
MPTSRIETNTEFDDIVRRSASIIHNKMGSNQIDANSCEYDPNMARSIFKARSPETLEVAKSMTESAATLLLSNMRRLITQTNDTMQRVAMIGPTLVMTIQSGAPLNL